MIIYKGTNNLVNGVFLKCFSIYTVVKLGITGQFITFIISVQSIYCRYSQTCVKHPHKTRHNFGFSDRWLLIAA